MPNFFFFILILKVLIIFYFLCDSELTIINGIFLYEIYHSLCGFKVFSTHRLQSLFACLIYVIDNSFYSIFV
jgi:hypothetical protein